jgi:hypothetical protein
MTRSDSGDPDPDQGNPFDLGLPMVRMPAGKAAHKRHGMRGVRRRRRRRPAGESAGDSVLRPADFADPEPVERPGVELHWVPLSGTAAPAQAGAAEPGAGDAPEALPAPEDSYDRSGDWEQWLDPLPSDPELADPEFAAEPAPRTRLPHDDFEQADGDESGLVPAVVDRSGVSPGPRLRHPRPRREYRRGGEKPLAVLIMLGIAIVVVSVVLTVIHTGRQRHPGVAASTASVRVPTAAVPAPTSQPAAISAQGCEQRRTSDVVSGTDPGGTGSGPDAILAFERAYYVQRSGFAARAVVADDATVPPAEQIQRGIDRMPAGTRYCVQITRAGDGQWEVRLTQQRPGEDPRTFTQIVTTRTDASRTLITAIHSV